MFGKALNGLRAVGTSLTRLLSVVATVYTFVFPPLVVLDCAAHLTGLAGPKEEQLVERVSAPAASRPAS